MTQIDVVNKPQTQQLISKLTGQHLVANVKAYQLIGKCIGKIIAIQALHM